jgi:hypothetical protein
VLSTDDPLRIAYSFEPYVQKGSRPASGTGEQLSGTALELPPWQWGRPDRPIGQADRPTPDQHRRRHQAQGIGRTIIRIMMASCHCHFIPPPESDGITHEIPPPIGRVN